ncbi:MAG: SDR family NAD(P)-dependent oxidoreductase [Myxococcales bacterium]|nr:SDR family NAD(P)-dependent oxidoreductase [Myxococcales bacterium]MCB9737169.1 SDR family NAD(P)-dependent oxidoreductase [Deltaproteobacteria bacterium]
MNTHILAVPRRIVITGASRGIGRETAIQLTRLGHRVVLVARDRRALDAVAAEIASAGGRAEVLPTDVTDPGAVEDAVATALAAGPVDVLVNNAGWCDQREWRLQHLDTQRAEMALNYWGAVHMTRALLPSFLARGAGVVVNVSSLLGAVAAPTTVSYGATKAALEHWSHGLRAEVAQHGVRVVVYVAPHTDNAQGRRVAWRGVKRLPESYAAARLVAAIDRAPRRRGAGPAYAVFLWLARHFPRLMARLVGNGTRHLLAEPSSGASPASPASP